jgi:S-disulfanyl-L-cysteine oxidoreductase SoxD
MRGRKLAIVCLTVAGALSMATAARSFPWSVDMYRGAAVQPLSRAPRVMPSNTLPVDRGEPPITLDEASRLTNPLTETPENLAHGKALFLQNCSPCHGADGIGNGSVAHLLKEKPKNLITGEVASRPDGFIFGVIRDGFELMPSYGDAMSASERWQVVLYIKSLRQTAASQSTAQK